MRVAFVLNNYNKGRYVYQAVAGALAQTYPCEVIISDYQSTDNSREEIERAISTAPRAAEHEVRFLKPDHLPTPKSTQRSCNEHLDWLYSQTKAEWIFQCSADDYSLPERVRKCMMAVAKNECDIVATTMRFEDPTNPGLMQHSGYPVKTGYVQAGDGLLKLAYGSTIHGFHRDFLEKAGSAGRHTADVYYGYLAALGRGYWCIAEPLHVHVMHAAAENMGFGGKLRAAVPGTDDAKRIAELNHFQLLDLYYATAVRAQELYPMQHQDDRNAALGMIMGQVGALIRERNILHDEGITPGII
jgi:glycosyltransferase involved in cell wall biosynthesis